MGALDFLDDDARREYWAALALRRTRGIGPAALACLLRRFGSAWAAVRRKEFWGDESAAESFQREEWRQAALPEWESARRLEGRILLWTDPRYPALLRETADAPALLYARGDLSLLSGPCVAVVGSRQCSQAGLNFAARLSAELSAAGVTLVSGLALGVDAAVHREALRHSASTIAVLASGLDVPYPAANSALYRRIAQEGLLLSEVPPGTRPLRYMFPARNRIMSGISLAVLVTEAARIRSGSLLTARLAAEQGREVCVPAPDRFGGPYPEGTKALLLQGATPIGDAAELLVAIAPQIKPAPRRLSAAKPEGGSLSPAREKAGKGAPRKLPHRVDDASPRSPDEKTILEILTSSVLDPEGLLCAALDRDPSWTPARVTSALMMLEVNRRIRRTADARYEVCP